MKGKTPEAILAGLPADRAASLAAVRKAIRAALPKGYEETVASGMIVWQVPASRYPARPLWLAALAAPKSYLTLHLLPVYMNKELMGRLVQGFKRAGKKLDIGKGCIHFKAADDLALDAIGDIIGGMPVDTWVQVFESRKKA